MLFLSKENLSIQTTIHGSSNKPLYIVHIQNKKIYTFGSTGGTNNLISNITKEHLIQSDHTIRSTQFNYFIFVVPCCTLGLDRGDKIYESSTTLFLVSCHNNFKDIDTIEGKEQSY